MRWLRSGRSSLSTSLAKRDSSAIGLYPLDFSGSSPVLVVG